MSSFSVVTDSPKWSLSIVNSPKNSPQPKHTVNNKHLSLRRLNCLRQFTNPPDFLTQAKIGLVLHPPELCDEGTGGTYFLKNQQNTSVAVFKPSNEEPLSSQNPKKSKNPDFHFTGFLPGEGYQREVLAYEIDNGFAGVPRTHTAEISHWIFADSRGIPGKIKSGRMKTKKGSIQEFIPDIQCTVDDMGYGKFSLEDVQRIAILDLLLVNCDRNGGNILVRKNSCKLVPIDHAFCLPDYRHLTDLQWFEWLTWKQVKQPTLPEVIAFIDKFDMKSTLRKAAALGIRKECVLTMVFSHMFLKRALQQKLTLYEIAKLMCTRDNPSVFANFVAKATSTTSNYQTMLSSFEKELSAYFR